MASLDARASHDTYAGNGHGQAGRTAPLYKRLPPGPHRLEREQVLRHQRLRIHGAMVEAVASGGYQATSVKQLIALAGVSRRSFYEQFANKQECFLATFDLLARRVVTNVASACDPASTRLAERLGPPLEALARFATEDPKAMGLLLGAAPQLGEPGLRRLCQASAACERMLGAAFGACAGVDALPRPVLRAVAGGTQTAIARHLDRAPGDRDHARLAGELLRWVEAFAAPSARPLNARAPARPATRLRAPGAAGAAGAPGEGVQSAGGRALRARLLESSLRLVAREGYCELTVPRVADEAGAPIDALLDTFASAEQCFETAVAEAGDGLLATLAAQRPGGGDWPAQVRRALAPLLQRLAERPLDTRALVELAFLGGEECAAANLARLRALTALLTAGALPPGPGAATVEMIAGALVHTLRCHVAMGRVRMLPSLADQLAFVVMAPCIGGERAVAALDEPR